MNTAFFTAHHTVDFQISFPTGTVLPTDASVHLYPTGIGSGATYRYNPPTIFPFNPVTGSQDHVHNFSTTYATDGDHTALVCLYNYANEVCCNISVSTFNNSVLNGFA